MRTPIGLLVLAVGVSSCSEPDTAATTTAGQPPATQATTTTQPLVVGCPVEERFIEGGVVDEFDNTGSDSTTIGLISWQADEACETFEIAFESAEGAPATTPPSVSAEFIDDVGVLRVFTSANETVIADQLVETALVDRLYVVRSLDGGTFIDFHLARPAQARVELDNSPRLTLELQPGIVDYSSEPTITDQLVLISPPEDSDVPLSLTVYGYGRSMDSELLLIATQGNEVVDEVVATSASSSSFWGEYRGTLELVPGPTVLFVGNTDAESGRFNGVSIDLQSG